MQQGNDWGTALGNLLAGGTSGYFKGVELRNQQEDRELRRMQYEQQTAYQNMLMQKMLYTMQREQAKDASSQQLANAEAGMYADMDKAAGSTSGVSGVPSSGTSNRGVSGGTYPAYTTGNVLDPNKGDGGSLANYKGLGDVVSHFESGGDPGLIAPDAGGKSYGAFQLNHSAKNPATLQDFVDSYGYTPYFTDKPGTQTFDAQWKAYAASNPEFLQAQKDYALKKYYQPMLEYSKSLGIDTSNPGVQEALLATANAHGPQTGQRILGLVAQNPEVIKDPNALVNALYTERTKTLPDGRLAYWSSTQDPNIQASLKNRLAGEANAVATLAGGTINPVISPADRQMADIAGAPNAGAPNFTPEQLAKKSYLEGEIAKITGSSFPGFNQPMSRSEFYRGLQSRMSEPLMAAQADGAYTKYLAELNARRSVIMQSPEYKLWEKNNDQKLTALNKELAGIHEGAGAYDGKNIVGQAWNHVIALKDKIANGTATQKEKDVYLSSEAILSQVQTTKDANGNTTSTYLDMNNLGLPSLVGRGNTPTGSQTQNIPGTGRSVTSYGDQKVDAKTKEKLDASKDLLAALDSYSQLIPQDVMGVIKSRYPNTHSANVGTAYTYLQMKLKKAFDLGVINGPDMHILENFITNPTSYNPKSFSPTAMNAQIAMARKLWTEEMDRNMSTILSVPNPENYPTSGSTTQAQMKTNNNSKRSKYNERGEQIE